MSDQVTLLGEVLGPLAHVDVSMRELLHLDGRKHQIWEIRAMVRTTGREPTGTDNITRTWMFSRAEAIIAEVEKSEGWKHFRAPRIEFSGRIISALGLGESILHECEVCLEGFFR